MVLTRATNLVARVCVCERVWESVTARMSAHGARPSEGGGQEGVWKEVESRAEPRKTRTPRFASAAVERRVKKMPKPMVDLKNKQVHVMQAKQVRLLSVAHGAARAAACDIGGEQGQKHGATPEHDCAATRASAGSPRGLRRLGRGARHRSW